jgi:hypothetical protein
MTSDTNRINGSIVDEGEYYADVNGYEVPQNIRHRFRSNITSELLADRDKVQRDRNDIDYVSPRQRTHIYRRAQANVVMTNADYTKISNDLRNTVCHGYPVERRSHSKTIHNEQVFNSRHENDQQTNIYRRRKDWLGRWTEANIVRDRLYKNALVNQKKSTQ